MRPVNFLARLLAPLLALLLTGCLVSERYERQILRELSLHAYDEGVAFTEEGNLEVALDRFNRSVIIDPRPAALFELGRIHEELGEEEQAAVSYMAALEAAPDYSEARFALLALGYDAPGEAEIKSEPARFAVFSDELLKEVDLRRLVAEEAEEEMTPEERRRLRDRIRRRRALAAEERMPTIEEVRGILFAGAPEADDIPSATDPTFATDREIILNTYPYHFGKGQEYQRNREYEKAAGEYELALRADPEQIEARLNLGDAMLRLERYPQAFFHYSEGLDHSPESARPLLKMGNYYDQLGQNDLAREFYRLSLEKEADYVEALNNLAVVEIREENFDEAIALLQSVSQIDPSYDLGYLNLGIAYENSGRRVQALEAYRRYVELGGDQAAEVRRWIAELE